MSEASNIIMSEASNIIMSEASNIIFTQAKTSLLYRPKAKYSIIHYTLQTHFLKFYKTVLQISKRYGKIIIR